MYKHVPHILLLGREEAGVRTAIAQGDSEPLTGSQRYVHPELPGRLHHGEGHEVGGADGQGPRKPVQINYQWFLTYLTTTLTMLC